MKSAALRERLGFNRTEWAAALGVNNRTVERWESGAHDPTGLAAEVMRGIANALAGGAELEHVKRLVGMGVSTLLYVCLKGGQ